MPIPPKPTKPLHSPFIPSQDNGVNQEQFHHGVCSVTPAMAIPAAPAAHSTCSASAETGATQHQSITAGKKAHPRLASAELLAKPGRALNGRLSTHTGKVTHVLSVCSTLWGHESRTPRKALVHERDVTGIAHGVPCSSSKVILRRRWFLRLSS